MITRNELKSFYDGFFVGDLFVFERSKNRKDVVMLLFKEKKLSGAEYRLQFYPKDIRFLTIKSYKFLFKSLKKLC